MSSLCLWKQEGTTFVRYPEMLFLAQDDGFVFS